MGAGASILNDNRGILQTLFTIREGNIIRYGYRLDLIGANEEDTEMTTDLQAYDSDDVTIDYDDDDDYDYDTDAEQQWVRAVPE